MYSYSYLPQFMCEYSLSSQLMPRVFIARMLLSGTINVSMCEVSLNIIHTWSSFILIMMFAFSTQDPLIFIVIKCIRSISFVRIRHESTVHVHPEERVADRQGIYHRIYPKCGAFESILPQKSHGNGITWAAWVLMAFAIWTNSTSTPYWSVEFVYMGNVRSCKLI